MNIIDSSPSLWITAALLLSCIGIGLLRLSWRNKIFSSNAHLLVKASGGFQLITAAFLWSNSLGTEYGLSYFFISISLIIWMFIRVGAETRPRKKNRTSVKKTTISKTNTVHKIGTLLCILLLATSASSTGTLLFTRFLPLQQVDQVVLSAFLFPIIWAIATIWVCIGGSLIKKSLALFSLSLAFAVPLFI